MRCNPGNAIRNVKAAGDKLLSAAEVKFCQAFFETGHAGESYRKAFPEITAADTMACRLLREKRIRLFLRELQDEAAAVAKTTIPKIVRAAEQSAFGSRVLCFDDDGKMLPPKQWPLWLQVEIVGFEVNERMNPVTGETITTYKVKLSKASEARDLLAKWLGMLNQPVPEGKEPERSVFVQLPMKEPIPEDVM